MNTRYNSFFQFVFTFIDLLGINVVFVLALLSNSGLAGIQGADYIALYIMCNTTWIVSAAATSLYINSDSYKLNVLARNTVKAGVVYLLAVLVFLYFYPTSFAKEFIATIMAGFVTTLLISRVLFYSISKAIRLHETFVRKVVIIGYNDVAKNLADQYTTSSKNIAVEGYFENYENVKELSKYPIIGNIQDCLQYAIDNRISEIYCTYSVKDYPVLNEMAEIAENNFIRFKYATDFNTMVNRNVHVNYVQNIPVLSLRREPLDDIANRLKKRMFDIVFSLFVIVFILSWLMPLIALLIKLDSKGPVFFNQNRLGRNLNRIKVFKFRTMKTTEADNQYKQATKDDPRVTKVGRFLRKTSLDELPQFFNVLLGDMSVVGPRPHPLKMNDDYKQIINKYMIRHFLKPGITGWAQVNGYRGETKELRDIEGRIEHDIWYMENWKFLVDIKIIFLTVYNVIKGEKNAY